jgi:flagellar secretion chaperone FliS
MVRGAEAYRQTEARSRSPLELVVMLYDGALGFLGAAGEAAARGDVGTRARNISRALAIIGELQSTLNMQEGGAVAADLNRLYAYVNGRLLDVSVKRDITGINESIKILTTLRSAWVELARSQEAMAAR